MDETPIHPLQAMVNGMNAEFQRKRSGTQMTLGALIKTLEALRPEQAVVGLGDEMSYRGYYCDLAFEPSVEPKSAAALLDQARGAMGRVYEGYKGGDFTMGANTPLWIEEYGSCGPRLMSLNIGTDPVTPVTAEEDD